MSSPRAENPIQTTRTSVSILRTVADMGGATLAELDETIDLSKGALYNHLATLAELDLVENHDGTYYVSLHALDLGEAARRSLPGLEAARTSLWNLADTTGEYASLIVREDDEAVVVDTAAGNLSERSWLTVGERLSRHSTAAGKVVLSELPEDRTRAACAEATADTEVDPDALVEEIKTVRVQGLAFSRGEYRSDQYGVAAPVKDGDGTLLYVVSVSGPESRLNGKALQQDVAGLVVSTATEIQKRVLS